MKGECLYSHKICVELTLTYIKFEVLDEFGMCRKMFAISG